MSDNVKRFQDKMAHFQKLMRTLEDGVNEKSSYEDAHPEAEKVDWRAYNKKYDDARSIFDSAERILDDLSSSDLIDRFSRGDRSDEVVEEARRKVNELEDLIDKMGDVFEDCLEIAGITME